MDIAKLLELKNKVVLITGGLRGICLALAQFFAQNRTSVVITGQSEPPGAAGELLSEKGGEWSYFSGGLTIREQRNAMIAFVKDKYKNIDILINKAGSQTPVPAMEYPVEQWDNEISLMLTGALELSRMACQLIIEKDSPGKSSIWLPSAVFRSTAVGGGR